MQQCRIVVSPTQLHIATQFDETEHIPAYRCGGCLTRVWVVRGACDSDWPTGARFAVHQGYRHGKARTSLGECTHTYAFVQTMFVCVYACARVALSSQAIVVTWVVCFSITCPTSGIAFLFSHQYRICRPVLNLTPPRSIFLPFSI